MKLALYQNLPPGGAQRFMQEVVARSALEHDYTEFEPVFVEREWVLRPLTNALSVASQERRIAAEIDAGGFDAVFVHGCRVMQAPGVLAMLKTPSVYMIQEPRRRTAEAGYHPGSKERTGFAALAWGVGRSSYDAVLGRRDRKSVAGATTLACNSKFSAQAIAHAYVRDATVCYAGVDSEKFRPNADGSSSRSFYLSVGALDASKGHDLSIAAIGGLAESDRMPLVIIGSRTDDAITEALRAQSARVGVELVLRASVTEAELVDAYRNAAAVLCMAHREPFGLTVHEAVACGTPVVAVREGGYQETVVDGVNGVSVERDAMAVAAAIMRLSRLGLAVDPWALHAQALPWTWESTVARLHELLAAAAEGGA